MHGDTQLRIPFHSGKTWRSWRGSTGESFMRSLEACHTIEDKHYKLCKMLRSISTSGMISQRQADASFAQMQTVSSTAARLSCTCRHFAEMGGHAQIYDMQIASIKKPLWSGVQAIALTGSWHQNWTRHLLMRACWSIQRWGLVETPN